MTMDEEVKEIVKGFIKLQEKETQDLHCWAANQQEICVATGSTGTNTEQL